MMFCRTCLAIQINEIVAGKVHEHKSLDAIQLSVIEDGCNLCAFFLRHVLKGLKRPLGRNEVLQLTLEQHSSANYGRTRGQYQSAEELIRLNDEDREFRDASISDRCGYSATLVALVGRVNVETSLPTTILARELCYVSLELSTETGESNPIGFIGRLVRQNPCDPMCFSIMSGWIRTCLTNHDCGTTVETQLPSRILAVGEKGAATICLQTSDGRRGHYVTLSHCWGKQKTLTTTKGNIVEHLTGIELKALPANFRDAVIISRELGYDYLWIDSLCIIQGDQDDWVKESSLMGQVYRNCSVMLAASSAADTHGGILNLRSEPCRLPHSDLYMSPKGKPFTAMEESELGSRAWASQERILAPRIVYYASDQIFWECRDSRKTESSIQQLQDTYSSYNKRYHDGLSPLLHAYDDDDDVIGRPEGWFWAVQGFSRRHLTNPSDKLPAISGLASNVYHPRRATGGRYLAGIWANDYSRQLLWENGEAEIQKFWRAENIRTSSVRTIAKLTKTFIYRAPTWSFLAYDGPIDFDRADDRIIPDFKLNADQWKRCQWLDLRVIATNMRLATEDPYGQVIKGSSITVEGMCQVLTFRPGQKAVFADAHVACLWKFDFPETSHQNGEYVCIQVGRRRGDLYQKYSDEDANIEHGLVQQGVRCLVLKQIGGVQDQFQRVGVLTFDVVGETDSGWQRRTLILV